MLPCLRMVFALVVAHLWQRLTSFYLRPKTVLGRTRLMSLRTCNWFSCLAKTVTSNLYIIILISILHSFRSLHRILDQISVAQLFFVYGFPFILYALIIPFKLFSFVCDSFVNYRRRHHNFGLVYSRNELTYRFSREVQGFISGFELHRLIEFRH